jgi:haloacetate dehalogenase
MFEGLRHSSAQIGEVNIAYAIGGSGPPVLLLHGFPQNRFEWARVAPLLAQGYTVVAADLRGYGDSSKPTCAADSSNYSFRAMAGDQVGLMQHLGFEQFHVIGHDRGGRTAHRMALDHPRVVKSLTVMDIVPTHAMFMDTNRHLANTYWHWYFLAQPAPFPETLIASNPDFFYETCLLGWGAAKITDFESDMLAAYRKSWRDAAMIQASCGDYRAALHVDLQHDAADIEQKVQAPSLVLYGAGGAMAKLFDMRAEWAKRLTHMRTDSLPGGHFFVDQFPKETAQKLLVFLSDQA